MGLLDPSRRFDEATLTDRVRRMALRLERRGPDDEGAWADEQAGIALGQRRLAIVDLTPAGHQPMTSRSGRWTIVFNGEIYNHDELAASLAAVGRPRRGTGDTEALLEGIDLWGVTETLRRCNGMFAIAAWDRHRRELVLARDRIGEKPLTYGWVDGQFVFASEVRAFDALPGFSPDVDPAALSAFLRRNFVPGPLSIYTGLSKLPPGTTLTLPLGSARAGSCPEPVPYWCLESVVARSAETRWLPPSVVADRLDALDGLLARSVEMRMHADVPLGAFLSGGVDSSLIVALMAEAAGERKVRTFTIAFDDERMDESADAARVAAHLGTDHTTIPIDSSAALDLVPRLPEIYDEPFADPSGLPTHLVSAAARQHVTVTLSGDGGDEVFAGYNRYLLGAGAFARTRRVPARLRRSAARGLGLVGPAMIEHVFDRMSPRLPSQLRVRNVGDKVGKLARLLEADSSAALYRTLVSSWPSGDALVDGGREPLDLPGDVALAGVDFGDVVREMMWRDTAQVLPEEMLVKVDRASMAASLEVRVPVLDHEVVEAAWGLPTSALVSGGKGKAPLRRLLDRHVPAALIDRPKMGFDPPVGAWLRGPLRTYAGDLLATDSLVASGLRPEPVRAAWDEHQAGTANHDYALWAAVQWMAWWSARRSAAVAPGR